MTSYNRGYNGRSSSGMSRRYGRGGGGYGMGGVSGVSMFELWPFCFVLVWTTFCSFIYDLSCFHSMLVW